MGDLELLARDHAADLVIFPVEREESSLDETVKDVLDALKEVQADKLDEKLEAISPVIEQDIDPEVYASAGYSVSASYGDQKVSVYYHGLDSSGNEANVNSYEVDASAYMEHELMALGQEISASKKFADMMGRVDLSSEFDPAKKAAKEEIKMRSVALWQMMYALAGKIDFL
ncbi:hypothetical protein HY489_05510 [Candidatus Woesearchaeota archaeon]|nr:hypothetical protein [Candidatus Woesearchaeota archaeon]